MAIEGVAIEGVIETGRERKISSRGDIIVLREGQSWAAAGYKGYPLGGSVLIKWRICVEEEEEKCKAGAIPEIPLEDAIAKRSLGLKVMCSFNGLLCLAPEKDLHPIVIYNPITKVYRVWPKTKATKTIVEFHQIGLGFDPSTNKYKVVRIYNCRDEGGCRLASACEVITSGEISWRKIVVLADTDRVLFSGSQGPVVHNGSIYWTIVRTCHPFDRELILRFDIRKEVFQAICFYPYIKAPPDQCRYRARNLQLQILGQGLFLLDHDGEFLHSWRLTLLDSVDGTMFRYNNSVKMKFPKRGWHWYIQSFVCMPSPGKFLLERVESERAGSHQDLKLVYYSSEHGKFLKLKVSGLPEWYRSRCFKPSLLPVEGVFPTHL
ncbi:unnamed protein product [Ilex paraguariensis]|uniref:F-box associated beta-propeller type 3 domain-containing protein n=1 Tax=Ilex paraguariensis TaxID=185542 RepID=A0ABC8TIE8_9AQUA